MNILEAFVAAIIGALMGLALLVFIFSYWSNHYVALELVNACYIWITNYYLLAGIWSCGSFVYFLQANYKRKAILKESLTLKRNCDRLYGVS